MIHARCIKPSSLLLAWLVVASPMSKADATGKIESLIRKLGDDSYAVRIQATQELVDSKPDPHLLKQLSEHAKDPEIRMRIALAIGMNGDQWIPFDRQQIDKLQACGNEGSKPLFLARGTKDGSTYIGKYLTEWGGANFPVDQQEVMINEFSVWSGTGTWQTWKPGLKRLITMGTTRDGKPVYAVRAELNNGVHPGMLIEGEPSARISWGGAVHQLKDFEVLTSEVN